MNDAREPAATDARKRVDRAVAVAAIGALAAVAWCACVFGLAGLPVALFAMPASGLLWLSIANQLEGIDAAGRRFAVALGFGLVSPVLGLALAWVPTLCCVAPWVPGITGAAMVAHLWTQPWLWLPFGVAMGVVAFAVVSVRRTAPSA